MGISRDWVRTFVIAVCLALPLEVVAQNQNGEGDNSQGNQQVHHGVPEIGVAGLAAAGVLVLGGTALLMTKRRKPKQQ